MTTTDNLRAAFATFIQYGFKKTSMEDLARAMNVSRQALYKRYGSKEAIFRTVAETLIEDAVRSALEAMQDTSNALHDRLYAAFDIWAGRHVDALRSSPHSTEVLSHTDSTPDGHVKQAEKRLHDVIEAEIAAHAPRLNAADVTFVLFSASYGLLYKAPDHATYEQGMRRAIAAFGLDQPHLSH